MAQFSKDYAGGFLDGPAGGTPITGAVMSNIENGIVNEDVTNQFSPAHAYMFWTSGAAYTAGQQVISPNGDVVSALSTHTAGGSFDPTLWSVPHPGIIITPALSQSQIQNILNGLPYGTHVTFTGTFNLSGALTVAVDGTYIDARFATFNQSTWATPGFDAIGRTGCVFDIGMVAFTGTRPTAGTGTGQAAAGSPYRGSSPYCSGAGVWINGDRNYVRSLRTSYMPVGVFLSSWNGTSTYDHVGVSNRIGVLESDHADWGVLYVGQQDLVIDDIYVHDDIDDSAGANPTHAIYCSATTSFRSAGGEFRAVRAKNIANGQPVQIKFHDSLHIGSINGNACVGLLNVIDSNDLKLDTYTSLGTLANGGQGAVTFQRSVTNSQRPLFGPGYIQMAANIDERVVNIVADNGSFSSMKLDSNHSSGTPTNTYAEVIVRGTGNVIQPKLTSLGAGSVPGVWVGFSSEAANNTFVDDIRASGTLNGVKVDAASTGVAVKYDAAFQSITGTSFFDLTGGTSVSTTTNPPLTLSTLGDDAAWAFTVGTGTVTVGAANSALQVRVTPRRKITVSSLVWWSVTASGNYDVAIVDDLTNAVLWTRAAGVGTVAWPAAGKITETVGSVVLLAGRTYRVVFAADNVTGTLRGITNGAGAGLDLRLDGSTKTTTVSSSFPISTSTLVGGTSGTTQRLPFVVIVGS